MLLGFRRAGLLPPDEKHPVRRLTIKTALVDRIEMFEKVLADENASRTDRIEALKFLVHFVGDIHQPLHAIDEAAAAMILRSRSSASGDCGSIPATCMGSGTTVW